MFKELLIRSSEGDDREMFIVIEGPNYSGKSTVLSMLSTELSKRFTVFSTKEPIRNEFGEMIRGNTYSLSPFAYHYLILAQREEHNLVLKSKLNEFEMILCDRYYVSNMVYQSMTGIDMKTIYEMNKRFLQPDIVIALNSDIEVLEARRKKRGELSYFEQITSLTKERQVYDVAYDFLTSFGHEIIKIDTDKIDITKLALYIIKEIEERNL